MYSINVYDGRVVSTTAEVAANPIYRSITENVAIAIENGTVKAKAVVDAILNNSDKNELQKMIDLKSVNVRPGAITGKETAAKSQNASPEKPIDLSDVVPAAAKPPEAPKPAPVAETKKPAPAAAFSGSGDGQVPAGQAPQNPVDFEKMPTNALRQMANFEGSDSADRKTLLAHLNAGKE